MCTEINLGVQSTAPRRAYEQKGNTHPYMHLHTIAQDLYGQIFMRLERDLLGVIAGLTYWFSVLNQGI